MNRKQIGTHFEYRIRDYLRKCGWSVFRMAGSKTAVDLIAIKPYRRPLFVQCKTTQKPYLSIGEKLELVTYKNDFRVNVLVVSRYKISKKLIFYLIKNNRLVQIEEPKWLT